eukprot:TRINITY_DN39897_c0_g1_i1.p1 TRINITY_DN39897_c0_g1~~TRINITY_DN39897_c0_g1_i1.p1  ORF type:complete len:403 (+),score=47.46 TRINITY_DN39897_c0_g1_i1:75-1283(+)
MAKSTSNQLIIYYKTGWQSPVLHYGFDGNDWSDAQFSHVAGEPDWWQVTVDAPCFRLECVPRARDKSGWDNPEGGGNYVVDIPKAHQGVHMVAVIRDGEVSIVNLSRPAWALVADMDGTLIGEPHETVSRLLRFWDLNCKFAVKDGVRLCQLVYNSGRNKADMLKGCRENNLPRPDFMICGVGTEIYVPHKPTADDSNAVPWYDCAISPEPEKDWKAKMEREFGDRERLIPIVATEFPNLEIHGNFENDPYRLPCMAHVTPEDPDILEKLEAWGKAQADLRVIVSGIGDHRYVDICSVHADKGLAIEHLFEKGCFAGISDKSRILVAGDSGNDLRMFMVPGVRSVMVGNSQPSLVQAFLAEPHEGLERPHIINRNDGLLEVYFSKGIIGDGVCEAIDHYYFN